MRGRVAIEEASREENTGAYSGVEGVELLQQYEGYEGGRLDQEQVLDNKDLKKIKYLKMKRAAVRWAIILRKGSLAHSQKCLIQMEKEDKIRQKKMNWKNLSS